MDPVRDAPGDEVPEKNAGTSANPHQSVFSNSLFGYTVLALGISLLIRFFIATPYIVSGPSMEPTFFDWHYLIVDKIVYSVSSPQRGDVVVFKLPQDASRSLIKRVIGLPGDTVSIRGSQVTIKNEVYPLGLALNEPYIDPRNASKGENLEVKLGADEYFVLGDNRHVSSDSRIWGKLPKSDLTGRVDVRLFPFNKMSILPGEARYLEK